MTHHQLSIQARFRPEMLERVLRVVRHRGFRVCAMNMMTAANPDHINIELTVASQRPVNLLSTQLSKLLDIACVEIQPTHHNKYVPEGIRKDKENDKKS